MIENWQRALDFNLGWEGGWAERKEEPGGAVNHGISMLAYREFRKRKGRGEPSFHSLQHINDEEVSEFYKERADQIGFDDLPSGYDLALFNASTMFGVTGAKEFHTKAKDDLGYLMVLQMEDKMNRPSVAKFGKGWAKRFRITYITAKDMATQDIQANRPGTVDEA